MLRCICTGPWQYNGLTDFVRGEIDLMPLLELNEFPPVVTIHVSRLPGSTPRTRPTTNQWSIRGIAECPQTTKMVTSHGQIAHPTMKMMVMACGVPSHVFIDVHNDSDRKTMVSATLTVQMRSIVSTFKRWPSSSVLTSIFILPMQLSTAVASGGKSWSKWLST